MKHTEPMAKANRAATIALVTMSGLDVGQTDDALLVEAIRAQGDTPVAAAWDDPQIEWAGFDLVWIRSCWDYHLRYAEFLAWFDRADRAGARWLNPAKAIVWNSHKRYLLDLRAAGVAVPALRLVPQGATFDTAKFLAEPHDVAPQLASAPASAGDRDLASDDDGVSDGVRDVDGASDGDDRWADVVIKPAVSASAYRTWRASTVTIDESAVRVAAMLTEGDVILQRFVPEIATAGEWSLIMVDGELNHAVRRVPAAGDFRSQRDYGAAVTLGDPPRALMATARLALACAGQHGGEPYVARLDLVETASGPVVMEVELIEPSLYLVDAADAATRIAAAIHRRAASAAAL